MLQTPSAAPRRHVIDAPVASPTPATTRIGSAEDGGEGSTELDEPACSGGTPGVSSLPRVEIGHHSSPHLITPTRT